MNAGPFIAEVASLVGDPTSVVIGENWRQHSYYSYYSQVTKTA